MKVKKYTSRTMPEAMNLIRKDLGPDAVILRSKEIQKGGFLGLFRKKQIEVFAGLDEQPLTNQVKQTTSMPNTVQNYTPEVDSSSKTDQFVLDEIHYLKRLIEKQSYTEDDTYPPAFQLMFEYLKQQEISDAINHAVIKNVINSHAKNEVEPTISTIVSRTTKELTEKINSVTTPGISFHKKVIQFVGPTGVGKTTTLAKVAAKYIMEEQKNVAFITMDTYRIAAIEQLKTYAKILDVPVEVAYSDEDYQQALEKLSAYDLILVDTAGRNFREEKYIVNIKKSSQLSHSIESYLVLSLTAKQKDLHDIQKLFQTVSIEGLIFTKLDETTQYGSILTIADYMNKSVVYITNGQDVPDDLMIPSPEEIAKLLLGDYANE